MRTNATSSATSPAHTAGPWNHSKMELDYESCDCGLYRIWTEAPTHPDIADVFYRDSEEEAEANARLIAAAPDLLEACEIAFGELDCPECDDPNCEKFAALA